MPSNHLTLCHSLVLLPSIFTSIRVFSSESALHIKWPKYWRFSFSISLSNAYSALSEVIIYKIIKIKLETKCIFCINFHLVAQMVKNSLAMQKAWVRSMSQKIPWRREGQPIPVFLPLDKNPMDRGVWRATVHRVTKSQTLLKRLSSSSSKEE